MFLIHAATSDNSTLSLHDALPISRRRSQAAGTRAPFSDASPRDRTTAVTDRKLPQTVLPSPTERRRDRKSTRLNSSHGYISYAVFCLKITSRGLPDACTIFIAAAI